MKKLLPLLLLCAAPTVGSAQKISLGLHGGYGTTWMLNSNVFDQDSKIDHVVSFGPMFGLQGEVKIAIAGVSVVVGLDYAGVNQKYKAETMSSGTTIKYDVTDKLKYFEVPILVRKYTGKLFFIELGPKFSFLTSAKEKIETSQAGGLNAELDVKDGFKKTVVSAVLGLGVRVPVAPHIHVSGGLRLAYGFTDATQKFSSPQELLDKVNAEKVGVSHIYAHASQNGDFSYKASHLATGHVIVGVSYTLH